MSTWSSVSPKGRQMLSDADLAVLQGLGSMRDGTPLVHAFPFEVDEALYTWYRVFFKTNTRDSAPLRKGVLRVDL